MELVDEGTKATFLWRLLQATQDGLVSWKAIDSKAFFRVRIGRFGYTLRSKDDDDFAPFLFGIFRFENVDDDDDLVSPEKVDEWETSEHSALNDPLAALYLEVKRKSLGLDSIVSEMFEALAEKDGKPASPDAPF